MPIYDYRCRACRKRFAVFFRSFSDVASAVRCEHCGSEDAVRMAPRVAQMAGEDARLDRLGDEMGDDLDGGVDEAMDDLGGADDDV